MVEKCKPSYKNLGSFNEQNAATVQRMNRICSNEEYLYQQSEKLKYLSVPAVRKRFNPVLVDESQSYGFMMGGEDDSGDINICFSNILSHLIDIDFSDLSWVDENKSTCGFESYYEDGVAYSKIVLPRKTASSLNTNCKNWDLEDMNSAWYVGFDKNKPYQIRPDWIKNEFDPEIPSICRAQTIVIPEGIVNAANKSSFLEAVTLRIENNGRADSNWASPLYVQLWPVKSVNVAKTEWRDNQNVPVGGYDTIYVPDGTPSTALATSIFYPDVTSPINFTFVFDKPVRVSSGEHYAVVVLSPLSHWGHCPRIGGWGRNCNVAKDNGGDAFLSEDNGRTWIRYGKNDDSLTWDDYKFGKLTPQDFAFQAHIRTYEEGYEVNNPYYLYLNPIMDNPIKSVYVTSYGEESNQTLVFQVSTDGKDWTDVNPRSPLVTFEDYFEEHDEYPHVVFVRAKLLSNNKNETPSISSVSIIVNNALPKEMYVRSRFYNPKLTPMLGANVWGRVYAPFELIPSNANVDCKVEIIQETMSKEHFHIITVDELDQFLNLVDSKGESIIDKTQLVADSDKRAEYLIDNPSVILKLKKCNVYVKPYTLKNVEYLLSFEDFDNEGNSIFGGLKLSNSPAYPIQECIIQPLGNQKVQSLGEWYDYDMDYDNDTLTLVREVLDEMPIGTLSIAYNRVFIQDLTLNEVGDRIDDETGLKEQGLILDYFKEEILITASELETRRVPLRVVPVDPLREVTILRGDDEIIVYEDSEFTVDYAAKELIFRNTGVNAEESILKLNDVLKVVYTPNIDDTGIAIGYTVKREDLNHQIRIKPNYIEYK